MRSSSSSFVTSIVVALLAAACASTASPAPVATQPPSTQQPSAPASATPSSTPIGTPNATPGKAAAWLDAGDLDEPRDATHVVVVGSGEVLVVGSDYQTSWLSACGASTDGSDSVEIGDPLTGVWKRTTSLPSLRDAPAVVALPDGRALMTGGAAGENIGWSAYSSTYVFDPATRLWSRSGLLNTARTFLAAAVLPEGRVLVAGGMFLDRASSESTRVLDTAEVWDPRSGEWSRTGRLSTARFRASAVTLADGRVLLVGGVATREDDPIQQSSAEVYDPTSGRWEAAGALATARGGFTLVALADGSALAVGGFSYADLFADTGHAYLSVVERFDPVSNTWSPAENLPFPAVGAAGIMLADGRVLIAGGSAREPRPIDPSAGTYVSGLAADAALFDPATGAWTVTTPMPSARAGASAVLLADGSALFAGGSASEGEINATPGCPVAEPMVVRYVPAR